MKNVASLIINIILVLNLSAQQPSKISVQNTLKLTSGSDTLQYALGAFVGQWMAKNAFTV